ncbi:MAG: CotH kinase family protein [Clostridia bacterium]|nr:CotH kinase family protein [Clostridia bacterium]
MKRFIFLFTILIFALLLISCEMLVPDESSQGNIVEAKYLAESGGSILGEATQSVSVPLGESHTFSEVSAVPNEGYVFIGWSDGVLEPSRTDTLIESAAVTAMFMPEGCVRFQYLASEGGYIDGKSDQRLYPNTLTELVVPVAYEGYVFIGWSDEITRQNRSDVAIESKSVTALFKKGYSVSFECDPNEGTLTGTVFQVIEKGQTTTMVTATPEPGYSFVKWSNGGTSPSIQISAEENVVLRAIFERHYLDLPVMSIYTEASVDTLDKTYKGCGIEVENAGDYNLTRSKAEIRGRGNTSFQLDKRSYKIKFDKAISLFGNTPDKEWTLISNHFDLSLVRNYLAYSVASKLSALDTTTSMQFVELYINNEYRGVYLVCEQVEIDETRINLSQDLSSTDTGYLIELDSRAEGLGFYANGSFYAIKDPDSDNSLYTPEHTAFIKNYVMSCLTAINGDDYSQIEALIDTESFAQAYVVFEMFHCVDVGFASFFMYKDAGGKLVCGPVWDFDRSVGNVSNNYSSRNPETLYASWKNSWFSSLLRHEEFHKLVCDTLSENEELIRATLDECYSYLEAHPNAFNRNFKKWKLLGTYVYPNPSAINNLKTWKEQVEFNKEWLEKSLNYMLKQYPSEAE